MSTPHLIRIVATLGISVVLAGCSMFDGKEEVTLDDTPPGEIFQLGEAQLADRKAIQAAKTFNAVSYTHLTLPTTPYV